MFSVEEKKKIAAAIEKLLLDLNHPEMPKEKPSFRLNVTGKEGWSWAEIEPNWVYEEKGSPVNPNGWNEVARKVLEKVEENKR